MQKRSLTFIKRTLLGIILLLFQFFVYHLASFLASKTQKTIDFLTLIDQKIPFLPNFIYPYLSLYILFIIYFVYLLQFFDRRDIWTRIAPSIISMIIIACIIFIFFPSNYPRPDLNKEEMHPITRDLIEFLYKTDPPNNTTPSLHVTSSFLFALMGYDISKIIGIALTIWAIIIMFSTLFVKQHYITDAITGIILAAFIYFIIYQRLFWVVKLRRKYEQKKKEGVLNINLKDEN